LPLPFPVEAQPGPVQAPVRRRARVVQALERARLAAVPQQMAQRAAAPFLGPGSPFLACLASWRFQTFVFV